MAEQVALFDLEAPWETEWRGMPEFDQEDLMPGYSLIVHFESHDDFLAFTRLIEQDLTWGSKRGTWFPKTEMVRMMDKRYGDAT